MLVQFPLPFFFLDTAQDKITHKRCKPVLLRPDTHCWVSGMCPRLPLVSAPDDDQDEEEHGRNDAGVEQNDDHHSPHWNHQVDLHDGRNHRRPVTHNVLSTEKIKKLIQSATVE